jgi:hypothetical protein
MAIDLKLIDKLLADYKNPEDIIGENGAVNSGAYQCACRPAAVRQKLLRSDMCLPSLNAMVRKLSIPLVKIPDHTEPHDHIWSRVRGEVGGKRWSNRPPA